MNLRGKIASAYVPALRQAAGWQFVFSVLASLLLDGGRVLAYVMIVTIVFWLAVGTICVRRPDSPTKSDLSFIQVGLPMLCLLAIVADLFRG
jgi:hypothetical protein